MKTPMRSLKVFSGYIFLLMMFLWMNACTGLKTYPMTARAGDTIAIGVGMPYFYGGVPEKMTKDIVSVKVRRKSDNVLVYTLIPRAVFNLYPDPRSQLATMQSEMNFNYSQAIETVVALDLPTDIPNDTYQLIVGSAGVAGTLRTIQSEITIVGQGGSPHLFEDELSGFPWSLDILENRPYKEVLFSPSASTIGAAELALTFNDTAISQYDIDVEKPLYCDNTKRMLYWKVVGNEIHIYILVPEGTTQTDRLKFSVVTPKGQGAPDPDPGLALVPSSIRVLDVNGNPVTDVTVSLN